jgi:cobalt-zinc-cadmium efflux system outer membrane protein
MGFMQRLYCVAAIMLISFVVAGQPVGKQANDTLHLSVNDAEKILLAKNLSLIANHYNIEIAHAQVIAAKLWDNPTLSFDINVWNDVSKIPFDFTGSGQSGEIYVHIEQIFKTAGKRRKLVQYSKANERSSEYEYYDLMRNLKYQFRNDFYQLDALLKTQKIYQDELARSKTLESSLQSGYTQNNVALKDLVIIQSTLFQLQIDLNSNISQINDIETDIRNLLGLQPSVFIVPEIPPLTKINWSAYSLDTLYTLALENRPDVKSQSEQVAASEWNLKYNKSLIAPDVTLGGEYDKANTYEPNYIGLFISLPLPLWNFNQGGVKGAKATLNQDIVQLDAARLKATNDVNAAYQKLVQLEKLDVDNQSQNNSKFDELMNRIYDVFQRREISLRDLVMYMDSYKQQLSNYNNYLAQYNSAKENLNMAIGKEIIK